MRLLGNSPKELERAPAEAEADLKERIMGEQDTVELAKNKATQEHQIDRTENQTHRTKKLKD